jgi:hypothetical protein
MIRTDAEFAESEKYHKLAALWRASLAADDSRRYSTVVTRPTSDASKAFLDNWAKESGDPMTKTYGVPRRLAHNRTELPVKRTRALPKRRKHLSDRIVDFTPDDFVYVVSTSAVAARRFFGAPEGALAELDHIDELGRQIWRVRRYGFYTGLCAGDADEAPL